MANERREFNSVIRRTGRFDVLDATKTEDCFDFSLRPGFVCPHNNKELRHVSFVVEEDAIWMGSPYETAVALRDVYAQYIYARDKETTVALVEFLEPWIEHDEYDAAVAEVERLTTQLDKAKDKLVRAASQLKEAQTDGE